MYKDPSRKVFGHKNLTYMENDMVKYVSNSTHLPYLIPLLEDELLNTFLSRCDGIIFQGGSDLSPHSYGKDFLDEQKWPGDIFRDKYEFKILDYCVKHKVPVFGICRGFQIINTYFKGTLHQDLATNLKTPIEHRCAQKYDHVFHDVIINGTILNKLYPEKKISVNSVHHQGVEILGKNLRSEAYCPDDNLIEAFSYKDMNEHYLFAVQWHPEFSETIKEKVVSPNPLIEMFFKASLTYQKGKK